MYQQPYPPQGKFIPFANPTPPTPPAPPRRGAAVAVLSGLVPVVAYGAWFAARETFMSIDPHGWFGYARAASALYGIPLMVPYLVPIIYLAIVGRSGSRKAGAIGLIVAAMFADVATTEFFLLARPGAWVTPIVGSIGAIAQAVLIVVAWGLARREGKVWLLSIAVAVLAQIALIALPYLVDVPPGPLMPLLTLVFANVVPIAIGWLIDYATRGRREAEAAARPAVQVPHPPAMYPPAGYSYEQGRPGPVGPPSGLPQNPPRNPHGR